jgi:WD40 repeat protein
VALSSDGRRALTGSWDKTAILWDAKTGEKLRTFTGHTAIVSSVALSGDGTRALTGSLDKTAILWDAQTGKKLRIFAGHTDHVTSVALSGDGTRALTGSLDHTAILWDAQTGNKLRIFAGHTDHVTSVALSGDCTHVLTGSFDKTAVLWNTQTGEKPRIFTGHTHWVWSVALSGDGTRALTRSVDKTAILWDTRSGKKLRTLAGQTGGVRAVALSSDGRRVLTGAADLTAILWDAQTGKKLRTLAGHTGEVNSVALSGDGTRALTGSDDETAILWDARSGDKLRTFAGHTSRVESVALSSDGRRALTGSWDKTAILWDAKTGDKLRTFAGYADFVLSVALSSDGTYVLTGSAHEAILWDTRSGKKLRTFAGHTDRVYGVALSSDGTRVLTGSYDGTTRLWDPATGQELCALISLDAGRDWLVVTPDGLFDGSVNAPKYLAYRIRGTLDFVPLDKYLHRYYTPGLLGKLMAGQRPKAKVDIDKALPPKVRLVSPATALDSKDAKLDVKAEAESRGDYPVLALRLLLDGRPYQGQKGIIQLRDPRPGKVQAAWTLELEPGRHTVKVLADTELVRGVPSDEVEVRYTGGQAQVELPRLFVLAIGISQHTDKTLKLDYAALDAQAVAAAYKTHSQKLFRQVETKVLTDQDASRRGILQGLIWLRENVRQGDYAVFYFGGHGEKDKDGALYFLPAEADVRDLASTAISGDHLKRLLNSIPGRLTAVLDACHSGGIDGGRQRGPHGLTDDLLRDLIAEESGLVVLCATTGNEKAQESHRYKHGVFTLALLEGLAGKANRDKEGVIYLHELERYLVERVQELTGRQQHPVVGQPTSIRSFPVSKP